jgi:hypothetical protein
VTTHHELRGLAERAVNTNDAALASRVLSICRDDFGFSDAQAFEFVYEWTRVSLATWTSLVEEPDNAEH